MHTPYLAAARDPLKPVREPIPRALRFAVFERDGFTCRYCGRGPEDTILHIDHRKPVADGGKSDFDNLVTACALCNLGKGRWLPKKVIPNQRGHAFAALIYQRAVERFGVDRWEVFESVLDFCLMDPEPENLFRILLDSASWPEAKTRFLAYTGFPVDCVGDVV